MYSREVESQRREHGPTEDERNFARHGGKIEGFTARSRTEGGLVQGLLSTNHMEPSRMMPVELVDV
jgi:hypothetical protein